MVSKLGKSSIRVRDSKLDVMRALGAPELAYVQAFRAKENPVANMLRRLWLDEGGQDIAEYAVMLAVILVIVIGTVRLIGSNANTVFSQVGSAIQ